MVAPCLNLFFFFMMPRPPGSTLFPYTTLFRSLLAVRSFAATDAPGLGGLWRAGRVERPNPPKPGRSEEHTSELQSQFQPVCRLLLEKKNIAGVIASALAGGATSKLFVGGQKAA